MTTSDATPAKGSLLLVLALGVHQKDGRLYIESQAGNGLTQWLRHFERMTLGVKLLPGEIPATSIPIDSLGLGDRLEILPMPPAWTPLPTLRALPGMARKLAALIDRHDYLQFGISTVWGDWAALGALIAARKARKASVWTDRVESEVERLTAHRASGLRKYYRLLNARLTRHLEHHVIRRTTLGLFHGRDTFDAFSPYSHNPHLVHDIHLKAADRIPTATLAAKQAARTDAARPLALEIIYAGRAHPDKGVMDWIEALHLVSEAGIRFRARWLGDGPQLEEARARVQALGLAGSIDFPGALRDRAKLLELLRAADMMLFCHLTPESPRCLIEALVSGTPIVGYASAYPADLVAVNGGGVLTAMDPVALSTELIRLAGDGAALADLFERAERDGHDMNDEAVFDHRVELMKRYTGAAPRR